MKYKALISRSLTMADETIQIVINDTENFDDLKARIENALQICDERAAVQMFRLFEDTDLTNALTPEEYTKAEHAANLVYPCNNFFEKLNLGEGSAIEFTKINASGEVIKLFLHEVDTYTSLDTVLSNIFNLLDERLIKTNQRELSFIEYLRSLPYELRLKISMIMDILYGRNSKEAVISRLQEEEKNELPNGVRIIRNTDAT